MAVSTSWGGLGFYNLLFPARPLFEGDRMELKVSIEEMIDMNVLSEYCSKNKVNITALRADPDREVYITGQEAEVFGFIGPKRTGKQRESANLSLF
jgi:hypothetical protein